MAQEIKKDLAEKFVDGINALGKYTETWKGTEEVVKALGEFATKIKTIAVQIENADIDQMDFSIQKVRGLLILMKDF